MKKTLISVLALGLMMLVLASCTENIQVSQDDEGDYILASTEMDTNTANQINEIKSAFENALLTKNAENLMPYIDQTFEVTQGSLTTFFSEATSEGRNPYTLYDDYYLPNLNVSDISMRVKKSDESKDYIMITPASENVYAAMYLSENKTVSQMISVICSNTGGKWKIMWIDFTDYSYYGNNAPKLYQMMLDAKEAGNDMLSYIYAQMTYNIQQPGRMLCFEDTELMTDAIMERNNWGKDKFPMEIVAGKNIHTVGIALEEQGVIPMLLYHTQTDIKNAEALRTEAQQICDAFLAANPGITKSFDAITIRATNTDPSTATEQFDYESVVLPTK